MQERRNSTANALELHLSCTKLSMYDECVSLRYKETNIKAGFWYTIKGVILCIRPANERWCYNVTSSLIGWVHTQNNLCYPCQTQKNKYYPSITPYGWGITSFWFPVSHWQPTAPCEDICSYSDDQGEVPQGPAITDQHLAIMIWMT